jgi:hypothetical protein
MSQREFSLLDLPVRLAEKITEHAGGCWLWQGLLDYKGYGQVGLLGGGRRNARAHRVVYSHLVGPIPDGMALDHLCHNEDPECPGGLCVHRRCVSPAHLEPASTKVNLLRSSNTLAGVNARLAECRQGHPFDEVNTRVYVDRRGRAHRVCRKCELKRGREKYGRKRAAA